jgi:hypothetical protein
VCRRVARRYGQIPRARRDGGEPGRQRGRRRADAASGATESPQELLLSRGLGARCRQKRLNFRGEGCVAADSLPHNTVLGPPCTGTGTPTAAVATGIAAGVAEAVAAAAANPAFDSL